MSRAIKAGTIYFAIAFAVGFALGTLRTLILYPALGETLSVGLEIPVMLAVCWIACDWVIRTFNVLPGRSERASMGAVAFILLIGAETVLSVVAFGRSLVEHVQSYWELPAFMGLVAQIAFGFLPLLHLRIHGDQHEAVTPDCRC